MEAIKGLWGLWGQGSRVINLIVHSHINITFWSMLNIKLVKLSEEKKKIFGLSPKCNILKFQLYAVLKHAKVFLCNFQFFQVFAVLQDRWLPRAVQDRWRSAAQ